MVGSTNRDDIIEGELTSQNPKNGVENLQISDDLENRAVNAMEGTEDNDVLRTFDFEQFNLQGDVEEIESYIKQKNLLMRNPRKGAENDSAEEFITDLGRTEVVVKQSRNNVPIVHYFFGAPRKGFRAGIDYSVSPETGDEALMIDEVLIRSLPNGAELYNEGCWTNGPDQNMIDLITHLNPNTRIFNDFI